MCKRMTKFICLVYDLFSPPTLTDDDVYHRYQDTSIYQYLLKDVDGSLVSLEHTHHILYYVAFTIITIPTLPYHPSYSLPPITPIRFNDRGVVGYRLSPLLLFITSIISMMDMRAYTAPYVHTHTHTSTTDQYPFLCLGHSVHSALLSSTHTHTHTLFHKLPFKARKIHCFLEKD
jgi:hypothetical protein